MAGEKWLQLDRREKLAEYGNTCIQALTGSGAGPGNNAEAVCNGD